MNMFQRTLLINTRPFDQVQAVVPPFDDPELPVNTFRGWFLGIVSTLIFSGILQFFQLHSPPSMYIAT